ncbi:MAG: ArsR family transcriptional regulator, partial [Dehalococcoidia bacterium]|nr:ArsR family transcriptional regulator [Dehalococcoidia bacterium]
PSIETLIRVSAWVTGVRLSGLFQSCAREDAMQVTRKEILDILRKEGQATVDQLARQLALTSTCVRQHLSVLEKGQLVTCQEVRRKLGRPQFVYTLTQTANDLFPKSYHLLTTWLLDELKVTYGDQKAHLILEGIASRWANTLSPKLKGETLEEKVEGLVALLKDEGHLIEWEKGEEGFFIYEYDCRFHRVAEVHPEVCSLETNMMAQVLGTPVKSLECIMDGQGRCAYGIPSRKPG